jgi:Phytanoyl-CoA dioxygenase (PhyH)
MLKDTGDEHMDDPEGLWRTKGYVVSRAVVDASQAARLRDICDDVLEQWRRRDPQTGRPGGRDATVMRHLNHPAYFSAGAPGLEEVLRLAAHPNLIELGRLILGEQPMFRCTSYFMNPLDTSLDGDWHRDSQYMTADEASERAMLLEGGDSGDGVQLQVALVPSKDVELVPGSHLRYDTPAEYAIRRADGGRQNRSNHMPGALRISLGAGDAAAINSLGIHRGRYHTDKLRRTAMITYTKSSMPVFDFFTTQPWFLNPAYRARIPSDIRPFYDPFIEAYADFWRSGATGK